MATSTNSTHTPSTTPRPAPQPSTPAQLFYGARGRSGSIASSFAKQQASSREHNTSPTPPLPPLPTSTSLNQNSSSHGHGHSSSLSSFTFTRSSTFPALSSPVRTTFGPGSPARSTFGEPLPPIRAGEPFRPSSPSTYTQTVPQRNPSPLGGPSLSLPPSTRGFNRVNSGTKTYSNGSTCSASPPPLHARSTSTVAEQIPLARLPSKQSREALIPSAASHVKNSSPEASFGAMLINAGKRASFGFVGKGEEKPPSPHSPIPVLPEQGGLQARDERDKEKGWGDSVGGVRNPRESIVRFTRARSRSHSSGGSIRSSGSVEGSSHPRSALPTKSTRHPEPRRPAHVSSGWQPDLGPVVRNSKGKVMKQHELIASESRWFCSGHCVTGGGTRRVPAGERTIPGQDDWAYSVGATGYAYESTTATTPTTPEKREKIKRNRITLIPYPFVFSVLLVLGTAGSWMGTTCVWWWKNVSPGLAAAGAWLVLLVVVSMAKTAFADPGIVPRNLDPTPALDEEGIPYARDLFVRGIPVRVKYCVTCKTYRPLRSSHCRICDNCVDGCDHHCQWVNNCIGRRNYSTFITFLIACFLAILLMAVTAALHIYLQTQPKHGSKSFHKALGGTGVGSAVVFVVCAAVVWPVGTLLGYHIRLLALNVTTIEQLRNSAQVSIGGSGAAGPNAFSLGKWTRNAAWAFKLDHHNNKARMSRTPTPTSTTPTTRRAAMPPHPAFSAPYYPTTYQYQQQQPQQQPQPQQAPTQAHGFYDEHESRKRSASAAEQDEEDEAPSAGTSAAPTPREENKSKRTKTQRACDPCRRKKIRCDILPDTDPPICQHCKQYSFNCTFFLPITETRFKKKRMEEEQSGGSASTNKPHNTPPTPSLDAGSHSHSQTHLQHAQAQNQQQQQQQQQQPQSKGEVKIYGPTSLSFLVHSTATIPVRTMESYDTRYHQTWQVGASGEGFIQVLEPSTPNQPTAAPLPKPLEHRLERETLQNLINAYFREVSPTFCVITRDEFVRSPAPPPVLLYSMCVAAACSRRVERGVFEALRGTLATVMRNDDVLSVSSVANVQALLILSMNGDCHSVSVPNATSAAWLRAGAAIRMAQDLGMHRAEAVQTDLELRRRLWSACVIVDSWYAASYGHPLTINVLDCDVRLPRADEAEGHKMEFMGELVKLSILLGRVLKSIYSPTGLLHARDSILETLLADLDLWRHQLPQQFVFTNPATASTHAGLLHLYYACVCMMFWRVFMRISYSCPAHLKFSLTVERMSDLVRMSRDVIDWLAMEEHERLFDCCYMVGYAATAAALIQYHAWARRKDPEAVIKLRKLKDTIKRWEASVEPGHMPTAEIICLLYEATQCAPEPSRTTDKRLNPTVGVHNVRAPEALRGLEFRKDASRPGGGVFVASKRMIPALSDLPRGTVVPRPDTGDGDRDRESVVSATSISGGSEESPFGYNVAQQQQRTNVNPALAQVELDPSENMGVQVLNMLDQPIPSESFAVDSEGMLSGIGLPNGLQYDLGANEQWNSLLSQFQPTMVGDPAYHLMQPFSEPYMGGVGTGQLHAPNTNGIGFPPMQPFPQQ